MLSSFSIVHMTFACVYAASARMHVRNDFDFQFDFKKTGKKVCVCVCSNQFNDTPAFHTCNRILFRNLH